MCFIRPQYSDPDCPRPVGPAVPIPLGARVCAIAAPGDARCCMCSYALHRRCALGIPAAGAQNGHRAGKLFSKCAYFCLSKTHDGHRAVKLFRKSAYLSVSMKDC